MPLTNVEDDAGHIIRLLKTERMGENYNIAEFSIPGFHQEQEINFWDTWVARGDDVIICGYPKSGTHWLWEITCMLLNGNSKRITETKERTMLEAICKQAFDNLPSPRVLNTHVYFRHLPQDFRRRQCKLVYIMRNPKDVAVSFYNHHTKILDYGYKGKWKEYLPRFIEGKVDNGSWFSHIQDWDGTIKENKNDVIHVVTYENLHVNCVKEVRRLAKFLNIEENRTLFESIAEACVFEKMKNDKEKLEDPEEWLDNKPSMYRKGVKLISIMNRCEVSYRPWCLFGIEAGQVGDWKNWFTVQQNENFDDVSREEMKRTNISLQFEIK